MDRFEVFLLACAAVLMISILYACVVMIQTTKGEVITIRVENKYTCIENEETIYKIITDSGEYTTSPYNRLNDAYFKLEPGKTYDVRLFNPVPPLYPEWRYGRVIKAVVNGPCVPSG